MQLNNNTLKKMQQNPAEYPNLDLPQYDRESTEIGIVHIGLGAFHRSHQAYYVEKVLNEYGGNWGICGVTMRNRELAEALNSQDGLYSIAKMDIENSYQIVGALKEVLVAQDDLAKVLARLVAPTTKMVSITVTEKGYCLNADGQLDLSNDLIKHDLENLAAPKSSVGMLVASLAERKEQGIAPFTVVACDNLPANGKKLKQAVIQLAKYSSAELADWIEDSVDFPSTMVDSITPKSDDSAIKLINEQFGLDDNAPVQRESFTQWVIEDSVSGEIPALDKVGVIFSDNVAGFEHTKLRILNGLHSTLAYIGRLAQHNYVFDAMEDVKLTRFLYRLVDQEIIPSIDAPLGLNLTEYSRQIISRFENPKVRYHLEQIACDGSIKIPVRTFEPIFDNLQSGRLVSDLYTVVAGWIRFIRLKHINQDQLNDPRADELLSVVSEFTDEADRDVALFLSVPNLVPDYLAGNSALIAGVTKAYSAFLSAGDQPQLALA
ncbi:mannitol dehydrogenase family protein [Catenovulum maritimum]|uniref:Mannitol dehydrogenase n=1 Tax=Catenovulum maritimum TaxID=1513271 RepID=A0A0J8JH79_9ALTE|nr:mannitol dehydrogenase family protein [Catenovulum maritimum]KMT63756.1 hypothetical protein XM47_17995 [Catenovulum maritimum]